MNMPNKVVKSAYDLTLHFRHVFGHKRTATRPIGFLLMPLLSAVIAGTLFSVINSGIPISSVAFACSVQSTTYTPGPLAYGYQNATSSGIEGVSADLWNYNPSPIFKRDEFYVVVWQTSTDYSTAHRAAIGWVKYNGDSNARVFEEVSPDSGTTHRLYYHSDGTWTSSYATATVPTASVLYEVYKYGGYWYLTYNYGTSFVSPWSTTWNANQLRIGGEADEYYPASPLAKGDHFPGDTSNKIHADYPKRDVNGVWSDTMMQTTSAQAQGSVDKNNGSGDGIRVWDNRCSD